MLKCALSKLRPNRSWLLGACLVLPISGVALSSVAKTSLESRYPYDPACPWGRLSNGEGMIHRCLTKAEAERVAESGPKPAAAPQKKAKQEPTKAASLPEDVALEVGPISAAEGEITVGRLGAPVDRYKKCVTENGGLTEKTGQVVVKFLVRAEFVRAEGAGVKSFSGMKESAARCVAAVVDRRKVGTPSVPITGAELTFSFSY